MLKYLTHKLRTQSINEDNINEKIDGHDSGTESDDGDLDAENIYHETDMEYSMSSRHDTTSPTDTACSSESPAFANASHLMYDQHSSEEELEVINGPAEAASSPTIFDDDSPKRSSSTLIEKRKRSLAHSSDEEVRNLLEHVQAPVNFRTSPPLEALKPQRGPLHSLHVQQQRATTPLVLTESGRGIESIRISCDSPIVPMDVVRSISPPAKLFHCAVSPRRRPSQRPPRQQRLHRPCLDFDKMQQLKARSVTAWRHDSEHSGEFPVFCW
ncbi:uncharacterized protein LOC129789107 isoform X3 [Lutzomyia longipalpis]|uniref:uncharacterized protein LOC129789107 isoform X3 n=1 Tax=Lutzomyia longipalpis TaxID=7200 RepID=UPI0024841B39|nr:uncharacterized protein LOC129789107 isoform X3 [Lutzomyia longipalpis]